MEQIHHIHHNCPTKAGRLAGVFKKRHPSRLSKKVCSPLGPLCEGDSPQRGEMSRSDRGAWARRAPPAGGGGENCTAARNISGYGKVLSLRPFGAPLPLWRKRHLPRIGGVCLAEGGFQTPAKYGTVKKAEPPHGRLCLKLYAFTPPAPRDGRSGCARSGISARRR